MTEDVDKVERARLARKAIIDHMDCDDCTEDYVFLLQQGGREFGMGLTTVLSKRPGVGQPISDASSVS